MPEVESECIFHTRADQIEFKTRTNGDTIFIMGLKLTQAQATSMAWLVNADGTVELEFNVKVKE
ncbi:unnamed protein product [marine sediment metagenome]|uniref:Uncharacterized protein n=1 Tax=marine sediment metagenome TaxID=412755 RepID=X0SL90_9ZZZZ